MRDKAIKGMENKWQLKAKFT